METAPEKPTRHPATFCWPPFLAIVPVIVGHSLGAFRPETFRHTHGYFEIAMMVGIFAAIGYTIRLRPHRADPRFKVPFLINLAFVILVAATNAFFLPFNLAR
jgi:hypothetical protein